MISAIRQAHVMMAYHRLVIAPPSPPRSQVRRWKYEIRRHLDFRLGYHQPSLYLAMRVISKQIWRTNTLYFVKLGQTHTSECFRNVCIWAPLQLHDHILLDQCSLYKGQGEMNFYPTISITLQMLQCNDIRHISVIYWELCYDVGSERIIIRCVIFQN